MTEQRTKWYTLVAACFALFMAILDNLVVNIALPTISRDLHASTTQLQWIVSAYTLVFASLQITAGGMGDRLGRKKWFVFGLGLFTAASLFGALSRNIEMLIAARAIQGLGAAFIMPLSLSLISVAFPPEERAKALGIWSAISVSGLAFGPVIGGALVEYANWHWVFLINIPIGIIALFVTVAVVKESRDTIGDVALDIPGTVLVTGAIGALTWGLIEAGDRGWGDKYILLAFAAAAALLAGFIAVEARVARPMVPLRFFRSTTFTGANIDSFAVSFLIAGVAFFTTLYQQNIHGFSPVRAGLALLPLVAMMMIGAPISGMLIGKVPSRILISVGMVIAGFGGLLLLRLGIHSTYLTIVPSLVVMGLGMSLIFTPMTTATLNSVESAKSGVASAVNGAVREVGTAFGIALLGTIANRVYKTDYNRATDIVAARSNPSLAPLRPVVDAIGSGVSLAGRVVEDPKRFPGLPPQFVGQVRDASAQAFVNGMDRAFVISSFAIFGFALLSFFLIKDWVVEKAPATADGLAPATPQGELPAPAVAAQFTAAADHAPVAATANGHHDPANGSGSSATYPAWNGAEYATGAPETDRASDTGSYAMPPIGTPFERVPDWDEMPIVAPVLALARTPSVEPTVATQAPAPPPGTPWTDGFLLVKADEASVTVAPTPAAQSAAEIEAMERRLAEMERIIRRLQARQSDPDPRAEAMERKVAELERFVAQLPTRLHHEYGVRTDELEQTTHALTQTTQTLTHTTHRLETFARSVPLRAFHEHEVREVALEERVATLEHFIAQQFAPREPMRQVPQPSPQYRQAPPAPLRNGR